MLQRKCIPRTPLVESIILHHHENYDGSGYPSGLAGVNLPLEVALVSILGSYDYFNTTRPGETASSPVEAWEKLKKHHESTTQFQKKFNPDILKDLDIFFQPPLK